MSRIVEMPLAEGGCIQSEVDFAVRLLANAKLVVARAGSEAHLGTMRHGTGRFARFAVLAARSAGR